MEYALIAAENNNLTLAFEPESENIVNSATRARKLLNELRNPRLRIVIDPANLISKTPPLIVGYEVDYIHPFSYATALSQLIPHSQLVRITPKALNKAAYLADLHKSITSFLENFHLSTMLDKEQESPS